MISGSFKFKPEIDAMHEEFRDHGVVVIAPDTGWLFLPRFSLVLPGDSDFGFRPLPSERRMSGPGEIERVFLQQLAESDFVYFCTPEGYAGNSVALEFGYALGLDKPMYGLEPMDVDRALPDARGFCTMFNKYVTIAPVAEAAALFRDRTAESTDSPPEK